MNRIPNGPALTSPTKAPATAAKAHGPAQSNPFAPIDAWMHLTFGGAQGTRPHAPAHPDHDLTQVQQQRLKLKTFGVEGPVWYQLTGGLQTGAAASAHHGVKHLGAGTVSKVR
jgi:hypothetical protein